MANYLLTWNAHGQFTAPTTKSFFNQLSNKADSRLKSVVEDFQLSCKLVNYDKGSA